MDHRPSYMAAREDWEIGCAVAIVKITAVPMAG
jgi:hypothetical protein